MTINATTKEHYMIRLSLENLVLHEHETRRILRVAAVYKRFIKSYMV